jgi:hypothetical protein
VKNFKTYYNNNKLLFDNDREWMYKIHPNYCYNQPIKITNVRLSEQLKSKTLSKDKKEKLRLIDPVEYLILVKMDGIHDYREVSQLVTIRQTLSYPNNNLINVINIDSVDDGSLCIFIEDLLDSLNKRKILDFLQEDNCFEGNSDLAIRIAKVLGNDEPFKSNHPVVNINW